LGGREEERERIFATEQPLIAMGFCNPIISSIMEEQLIPV
jgi:hypothetical protein